jgi:hypothetical protein
MTEEPIDGLSFMAYRRVSTTIVLFSHQHGSRLRGRSSPLIRETSRQHNVTELFPGQAHESRSGALQSTNFKQTFFVVADGDRFDRNTD